ncbi:MAG: hypothetical protein MSB80_00195 [Alphaproteobacteria bacterium]|nr:hypothetical protein [Alphaproteobacteria bacterium]
MDKQSKFNLLQKIALTEEEAEEYFGLQEQTESPDRIFLPMSIVYESKRKKLRVLPYLDLNQKDKVWGISFNGLLVHKQDVAANTYKSLHEVLHKENIQCSKYSRFRNFPSLEHWEQMFAHMTEFNNMMFVLRKHGIKADDLQTEIMYLSAKGILSNFLPDPGVLAFAKDDDTPIKSRFVVYL